VEGRMKEKKRKNREKKNGNGRATRNNLVKLKMSLLRISITASHRDLTHLPLFFF
jgi:hypothetical protein